MFRAVIGTLGYVVRDGQVLLVHRQRAGDDHRDKWNGLGGKLEPGKDAAVCLKRELREEAGIDTTSLRPRGTVAWPDFGPNGNDWFGLVFPANAFDGEPPERNDDGSLRWVPPAGLGGPSMWEGDRHSLPLVFDGRPQFHAVIPYRGGQVIPEGMAATRT